MFFGAFRSLMNVFHFAKASPSKSSSQLTFSTQTLEEDLHVYLFFFSRECSCLNLVTHNPYSFEAGTRPSFHGKPTSYLLSFSLKWILSRKSPSSDCDLGGFSHTPNDSMSQNFCKALHNSSFLLWISHGLKVINSGFSMVRFVFASLVILQH